MPVLPSHLTPNKLEIDVFASFDTKNLTYKNYKSCVFSMEMPSCFKKLCPVRREPAWQLRGWLEARSAERIRQSIALSSETSQKYTKVSKHAQVPATKGTRKGKRDTSHTSHKSHRSHSESLNTTHLQRELLMIGNCPDAKFHCLLVYIQ